MTNKQNVENKDKEINTTYLNLYYNIIYIILYYKKGWWKTFEALPQVP